MAVLVVLGVAAPAAQASLSVPSVTYNNLTAFEAAVRGGDNGTTAGEQGGGFRHFVPSMIAVDGSDPGTTAIPGGHTAALSPSRLQPWGLELGPNVAVANDGFRSVNSNAGFSPLDLWAPFNTNSTGMQIVAPSAQASTPAPAVTRGLGVVFVDPANAGATIEYYSGNMILGQVSPQSGTSFAGMLFAQPVVTRVVITFGTDPMFAFDGSTLTPGTTASNTLAAGDDVALAEPGAGETSTAASAGVPVSSVLASFNSNDAAADITATVDWGDGTRSSGAIIPGGGGAFTVSGSHTYALPGNYTATVTVQDFSGSELTTQSLIQVIQAAPQPPVQVAPRATTTNVACSPTDVAVSATTSCTVTVQDTSAGTATPPTGVVTFTTPTPGGSFPGTGSCLLGGRGTSTAFCQVQFRPGQRPPIQARITASYVGDATHAASSSDTTIGVHVPSCSLQPLTRRLRGGKFALIVTCDARINVQVTAQARATRNGRHKAFSLRFGSLRSLVTAGQPTVLVIAPAPGVLPALRTALHRHQGLSLKLTLTAGSGARRKMTTARVSALRLS